MAYQEFTGSEIVQIGRDAEFILMLDKHGNVHALYMPLAAKHLFSSVVPVVKNILRVGSGVAPEDLGLRFLHRGAKPVDFAQVLEQQEPGSAVFKTDAEGRPFVEFGDLAVEDQKNGRLLGVYSRKVMYARSLQMIESLLRQVVIAKPEVLDPDVLESLADAYLAKDKVPSSSVTADREVEASQRVLFSRLSEPLMENLRQAARESEALAGRDFDTEAFAEWLSKWEKYDARAKELVAGYEREQSLSTRERLQAKAHSLGLAMQGKSPRSGLQLDSDLDYQKLLESIRTGNYGERSGGQAIWWQEFERETSLSQEMQVRSSLLQRAASVIAKPVTLLSLASVFAGYTILEHSADLQLKLTSWLTQNAVPEVLKDFEYEGENGKYRQVLGLSVLSLTLLIPAAMLISWISVPSMRAIAKSLRAFAPEKADRLERVAEDWKNLDVWQRIVTFGFRVFATISLPFIHYVAAGLRQKNFIPSLKAGINPFGKQATPTGEKLRVGVNSIFATDSVYKQQQQALGQVLSARERASSMAWLLATKIVAHESQIDLATLMMVSTKGIEAAEAHSIFQDPEKRRLWQKHVVEIQAGLLSMEAIRNEQQAVKLEPEQIVGFYKAALKIAEEIRERSQYQQLVKNLSFGVKRAMASGMSKFSQFAVADNEFLRRNFSNHLVSGLVTKEFTLDHMAVVGVPAVFGERASLARPEELSAISNPWYLWTHPEHIQDILNNMSLHFFQAGSQNALVLQGSPKLRDGSYLPQELVHYASMSRAEPFFSSMGLWLKSIYESKEAGEIYFKKMLSKRLTTVQGALLLSVVFRVVVAKQELASSLAGWYYFWIAGPLLYAWPWVVILLGMQGEEERIEANKERFDQEKLRLARVQKFAHRLDMQKALREFLHFYQQESPLLYRGLLYGLLQNQAVGRQFVRQSPNDQGLRQQLRWTELWHGDAAAHEQLLQDKIAKADVASLKRWIDTSLEYAVRHPAVFTAAHPAVGWLSVFGFGAVLTTVLAISVGVDSFDPKYTAWENLLAWTIVHTSVAFGVRALLHERSIKDLVKGFARSVTKVSYLALSTPKHPLRNYRYARQQVRRASEAVVQPIRNWCRQVLK